jgi:hypothetical protein
MCEEINLTHPAVPLFYKAREHRKIKKKLKKTTKRETVKIPLFCKEGARGVSK